MADRSFQDYASSGELNQLKIGGDTSEYEVHPIGTQGLLAFRNSTDLPLALTTTFTKVDIFDIIDVDSGRGHMTYDSNLARLVLNSTGVYKFRADGTFQLANNIEVEFSFYLNGAVVSPNNNPVFTGRGTGKNVPMAASRVMSLTSGDYLEIWAKVSSDHTLTIKSSNISAEKTDY